MGRAPVPAAGPQGVVRPLAGGAGRDRLEQPALVVFADADTGVGYAQRQQLALLLHCKALKANLHVAALGLEMTFRRAVEAEAALRQAEANLKNARNAADQR